MTPFMVLEAFKRLLSEQLTAHEYKLRVSTDADIRNQSGPAPGTNEERLAVPGVYPGNLPHTNFVAEFPDAFYMSAPYVLIGLVNAEDDYSEGRMSLLFQVCTYSQDDYPAVQGKPSTPDHMAYLDALNLLQFIKSAIMSNRVAGFIFIDKPIRTGMYATQAMTWPYAFGYLSIDVEVPGESPADLFEGVKID